MPSRTQLMQKPVISDYAYHRYFSPHEKLMNAFKYAHPGEFEYQQSLELAFDNFDATKKDSDDFEAAKLALIEVCMIGVKDYTNVIRAVRNGYVINESIRKIVFLNYEAAQACLKLLK